MLSPVHVLFFLSLKSRLSFTSLLFIRAMLELKHLPIFIGLATAQSQSTIQAFTNNFFVNDTLTLQGSNPTATTYAYTCIPSETSMRLETQALFPFSNSVPQPMPLMAPLPQHSVNELSRM
jgi:hypothetical protein